MDAFHQAAKQLRRLHSKCMGLVQLGKRSGRIARQQGVEQGPNPPAIGKPEHFANRCGPDRPASVRNRLVEQRQSVARRALRGPGDHRERLGLDRNSLGRCNPGKMLREEFGRDSLQIEPLAP